MNELIQMVGIILRFPFFCVGVFLWAVALMPLAVLVMLAQIVCIPFVFLSSAFSMKGSVRNGA